MDNMSMYMGLVLVAVLGYLLGSVSFAVVTSRVMGLADPRQYGSKNPGATNVLRSGSKAAAGLTLFLDGAKGWLPVFLVQHWGMQYGLGANTVAIVGIAVFLGHVYPVFLRFKGGKGVATFLGVVLGIAPVLGLGALLTWLIVAYFFRYSSLASLVTAVFVPVFYVFMGGVVWSVNHWQALAFGFMALLLILRHRTNIERLLAGKEERIGG